MDFYANNSFLSRAFIAWEENIAVDLVAEQQQMQLLAEYKAKLNIDGEIVEDPMTVSKGWLSEKVGMSKWPSLYIGDISEYLHTNQPKDLIRRVVNEYKEGKAYRYFTGEWVKEVFYHDISESSDKCVFKSSVTPSQAINNKAYNVWLVLRKDTKEILGGQVLQAYCSCTAGMLGSCNHIAGVLFRIEEAVKTGQTRKSCTSKPCEWTVPKKKTKVKAGRVSDFLWKKTSLSKLKVDKENEKAIKRRNFTPLRSKQQRSDSDSIRQDLYETLKDELPDSCFTLLMEKRKPKSNIQEPSANMPPSLKDVARKITMSNCNDHEIMKTKLLHEVQLSDGQLNALEKGTTGQSESECWKEQRHGRITASNFHRISRRSQSLKENLDEDPSSVIGLVMGTSPVIQTVAMKHGISTEPIAKRSYHQEKKSEHKRFSVKECGMFCLKSDPYISASPDLLVHCECCGYGVCEVKCPETVKDQKPTPDNIPYIVVRDGEVSLKRNHPYFYQIQGQMGITGRKYCDFFIFTFHGSMCLRVKYDEKFFLEMVQNLSWFWKTFIVKELLKSRQDNVLCEAWGLTKTNRWLRCNKKSKTFRVQLMNRTI